MLFPCQGLPSPLQQRERIAASNLPRWFSGFSGTPKNNMEHTATLGKSGLTVGDESLALAARWGVGWEVGREGAPWNRGSAAAEVGKLGLPELWQEAQYRKKPRVGMGCPRGSLRGPPQSILKNTGSS